MNIFKSIIKKANKNSDSTNKITMDKNNNPKYVEIAPEDIELVTSKYKELQKAQKEIGIITLEYDKRKRKLIEKVESMEKEIKKSVNSLRTKYNIPKDSDDYILNLPSHDNPNGSFIKNSHNKDQ